MHHSIGYRSQLKKKKTKTGEPESGEQGRMSSECFPDHSLILSFYPLNRFVDAPSCGPVVMGSIS